MRLSGVGGSSSRGRPLRRKLHPLSAAAAVAVAAAAVGRRRHPSYHSPAAIRERASHCSLTKDDMLNIQPTARDFRGRGNEEGEEGHRARGRRLFRQRR